MNRELWIMVLNFLVAVIVLVNQLLPVPPELQPWLAFAVAIINAALAIFFGVTGFRARAAAKAAK